MNQKLLIIFINGKMIEQFPFIGDNDEVFLLGGLSGKGKYIFIEILFINFFIFF